MNTFQKAIVFYSNAIEMDPSNPVLYSNRAFAYIKIEDYLHAEHDCDKAIELDSKLAKVFYRRGLARKNLYRYRSALQDFHEAIILSPENPDIKKEIDITSQIIDSKQPIRLKPIMIHDENLRSKMPLIDIPIHIENDLSDDDDAISKHLKNQIRELMPKQKPKNFVEFDRFWRELKWSDLKQEYLSTIDIDGYRKIFQYPFESLLLFDVLDTLSQLSNHSFVFKILDEAILLMPRFDLSFSFLSEKESNSK
ncbi:heat shock protein 70 (HSP70)-interacting protein-like protein [Euroglyphus maynei]|uniref:RNA polymerase II-associated protein 3 n=1 Tax=Euroglyphus maynei TaxID=6958 RepID=A0A1Y3ANN9_EURMA|nr:heat shock protein 70 (HSP70)-interacting protein-like protein [Euroglyphus maynei]